MAGPFWEELTLPVMSPVTPRTGMWQAMEKSEAVVSVTIAESRETSRMMPRRDGDSRSSPGGGVGGRAKTTWPIFRPSFVPPSMMMVS